MTDITDPVLEAYAQAHTTAPDDHLVALAEETRATLSAPQMMVGALEGRFLEMLVYALRPSWVLEIGTFSGYSSLSMAAGLPPGGRITTCELSPRARRRGPVATSPQPVRGRDRGRSRARPSTRWGSSSGPFDFVFIDADKTNYLAYYEAVLPKLAPRGLIAADNTLWSGNVVDDADQSDDTRAIRAFNDAVVADRASGVRADHGSRRRHAHPARVTVASGGAVSAVERRSGSMLDYHLHLWPHGQRDTAPTLEQVADYCESARAAGIHEVALTEHLFRFRQADRLLRGFWDDEPDAALRASMADYWDDHARADLDAYVECVLAAKDAGLPVVLGLEVDYYRGRMDDVATLLAGYPFDVLLGSVHWIGTWRFDDIDDALSMAQWSARDVDAAWSDYVTRHRGARRHRGVRRARPPRPGEGGRPPPRGPRGVLGPAGRGGAALGHGRRALLGGMAQARGGGLSGAGVAGAVRGRRGAAHDRVRRPSALRRGASHARIWPGCSKPWT